VVAAGGAALGGCCCWTGGATVGCWVAAAGVVLSSAPLVSRAGTAIAAASTITPAAMPAYFANLDANRGCWMNVAVAVTGTAPGMSGLAAMVSCRCTSRFHGSWAPTDSSARVLVPGGRSTDGGWNAALTRRSGSVAVR
jgi:hypothetical protein